MAWARLVVQASLVGLLGGCGPNTFGPPPPRVKARPALPIDASETARSVYLVMPGAPDPYLEAWGRAGQYEAGVDNSIFRAVGPREGQPSMKSSKLVRDSIGDGANSIVVVPDDDPDLVKAIDEAQAKKIPVVLLGKPLPQGSGGDANLPSPVTMTSLAPVADRLVATAIEDCKRIKLATDGTALIVDHDAGDPYRLERVEAFRQALERQGVKKVEVLQFEGKSSNASSKVLESIKKFPDIFLALCVDDEAMQGAIVGRVQSNGKPHFFVTGFVGNWQPTSAGVYLAESGHAEVHYENLARVAVRTALMKAKGGTGPTRKLAEPLYFRGEALTTSDAGGLKPPPPNPLTKDKPPGRDQ